MDFGSGEEINRSDVVNLTTLTFGKDELKINSDYDIIIQDKNILFLILILCGVILILVIMIFLIVCCQKYKPLTRQTRSTSTTGLHSFTQNLPGSSNSLVATTVEGFTTGNQLSNTKSFQSNSKDKSNSQILETVINEDKNEYSALLSTSGHEQFWSGSPLNCSFVSNDLQPLSLKSTDLDAGLYKSVSSSFPTDRKGHPRAWFVPFEEMVNIPLNNSNFVSQAHESVKKTSAESSFSLKKVLQQNSKIKKSESSQAKLESLPLRKNINYISKWDKREQRPVLIVSSTSNKIG